jgi:transglutaminase-like putative cysteine protease
MAVQVALKHKTIYRYDRPVILGPQIVRLRPAPHCFAKTSAFALDISPDEHSCHWQQDPFGNFVARIIFPQKTEHFSTEVNFIANLETTNPFNFFVEPEAEEFPFTYVASTKEQVRPFLTPDVAGPLLANYLHRLPQHMQSTVELLVSVNRQLRHDVQYVTRDEPGVQGCEETLRKGSGSCRDSAWLLVQILRHIGIAARFVSGYLVQLNNDIASIQTGSGDTDTFELHAWSEAYVPGAGWIGMDPTSGLLAGEGHIPLACAISPLHAAPITGTTEACKVDFHFEVDAQRLSDPPSHWMDPVFTEVGFNSEIQ